MSKTGDRPAGGGDHRFVLRSPQPVSAGRHRLSFRFRKEGSLRGTGELQIDDQTVRAMPMQDMWPSLPNATGLHCGRDDGSPVSDRYTCPFTFDGTLHAVVVDLDDDQEIDFLKEYAAALADD